MNELAVASIHKAIYLWNLWCLAQQQDESIKAFMARVTATADLCKMEVKCTCDNSVSYRDEVVKQIIIHGMNNQEIKTRVLSKTTSGELDTLAKMIAYIGIPKS